MIFQVASFIPEDELLGTLHKFAAHQSGTIVALQKIVQTADGVCQRARVRQHQRVEGALKPLACLTWSECHSRTESPQGATQ